MLTGDCDDAATLAASLLVAMGSPCTLVAIRHRGTDYFEHVFVRVPLDFSTFNIDPTIPRNLLPLQGDFEQLTVEV